MAPRPTSRPGEAGRWTLAADPLGEALRGISADRIEGASSLAERFLLSFSRALTRWEAVPPEEVARRLGQIADAGSRLQPAMGFFRRASVELRELAARPGPVRRRAVRWARSWRQRLGREHRRVIATVRRQLRPRERIVTISRSSLVRDALVALPRARRPVEVVALRSRPGGEGHLLVRELVRAGLNARLIEDRSLHSLQGSVDRVLLGADTVRADGSIVHKVGTRRLCLWARRRGIPVVVLAGRSKSAPERGTDLRPPARFDVTPARWITEYWTEAGRQAPHAFVRRSRLSPRARRKATRDTM